MIKNNIKAIRQSKNIRASELAAMIGTDQSMISRLEAGDRKLTLEWIDVLSRALGCQPWELLPDDWQPRPGGLDDQERFFKILNSTNNALRALHITPAEEEKLRFVLYLYNAGFGLRTDVVANDNDITGAVKIAWRA